MLIVSGNCGDNPDQDGYMKIRILFFFFALFLFIPGISIAEEGMDLRGFVLDNRNGTAEVSFGLFFARMQELRKALDRGEDLELFCRAEIHRVREYMWDEHIGEGSFVCSLYKDMLKDNYVFACPGKKLAMSDFKRDKVQRRFSRISIPLCSWEKVSAGNKYSITLKASLKFKGVPEWIKNTLFFWSWEFLEPAYYEMQFDY